MATKLMNFKMDVELINKLNYIAWHDRKSKTQTYTTAAEDMVKAWEKKNGKITEEKISAAKVA